MLFRALTTCAGKFSFQTGDTVDLPQADAADLVASGALLALESPAPAKTESEPATVASTPATKAKK
jgi:hypothetical protein